MNLAMKKILHRVMRGQPTPPKPPVDDPFIIQSELISSATPLIFDIGAYVGEITMRYRETLPSAKIYSFEPCPESFEKLIVNTKSDSQISCHNLAISSHHGISNLHINKFLPTNSLLATDIRGATHWGAGLLDTENQLEVPTTTVDDFCLESGIVHIDILKLDVQGAEFEVLSGAKNMLSRHGISLIYMEMIMCPTYLGQRQLYEYLKFLGDLGYQLLDFYNPVRNHHRLIQSDLIFTSDQL